MIEIFTDEELLAYADERLASDRCAQVEQQIRLDPGVKARFAALLSQRDHGDHTIGEIWRKQQLSCPPRSVWLAFVDGRLSDGLSQYMRFHLNTVGCRICAANLSDMERPGAPAESERRAKKIFQSSAGNLQKTLESDPNQRFQR